MITGTEAEYQSDAGPSKVTQYLAQTDELLGAFCEYLQENWPRYNGSELYILDILTNTQVKSDGDLHMPEFSLSASTRNPNRKQGNMAFENDVWKTTQNSKSLCYLYVKSLCYLITKSIGSISSCW